MRNDTPRTFIGATTFEVTGMSCELIRAAQHARLVGGLQPHRPWRRRPRRCCS